MMTTSETYMHDLRNAAYHEAGHLVVLKHVGGDGFITVEARHAADTDKERAFSGQCHCDNLPPGRGRILWALAGVVSELLRLEPDALTVDVIDYLENEVIELSDTDAAMASGYTADDVDEVHRTLTDNWDRVRHYAECEIQKFSGEQLG